MLDWHRTGNWLPKADLRAEATAPFVAGSPIGTPAMMKFDPRSSRWDRNSTSFFDGNLTIGLLVIAIK